MLEITHYLCHEVWTIIVLFRIVKSFWLFDAYEFKNFSKFWISLFLKCFKCPSRDTNMVLVQHDSWIELLKKFEGKQPLSSLSGFGYAYEQVSCERCTIQKHLNLNLGKNFIARLMTIFNIKRYSRRDSHLCPTSFLHMTTTTTTTTTTTIIITTTITSVFTSLIGCCLHSNVAFISSLRCIANSTHTTGAKYFFPWLPQTFVSPAWLFCRTFMRDMTVVRVCVINITWKNTSLWGHSIIT